MHGEVLRQQLADFIPRFDTLARPKIGRYAHQPATADAGGVRSVPAPLIKPWLKGLAVAGLAISAVALASASKGSKKGRKDKKGREGKKSKDDGSYRAWYRDNPAPQGSSEPDWQSRRSGAYSEQPEASQQTEVRQPSGQNSYADLRYSDQRSRKIETQYP
jgi:hypothetical protein